MMCEGDLSAEGLTEQQTDRQDETLSMLPFGINIRSAIQNI